VKVTYHMNSRFITIYQE